MYYVCYHKIIIHWMSIGVISCVGDNVRWESFTSCVMSQFIVSTDKLRIVVIFFWIWFMQVCSQRLSTACSLLQTFLLLIVFFPATCSHTGNSVTNLIFLSGRHMHFHYWACCHPSNDACNNKTQMHGQDFLISQVTYQKNNRNKSP